jgi:fatty acid desaturase
LFSTVGTSATGRTSGSPSLIAQGATSISKRPDPSPFEDGQTNLFPARLSIEEGTAHYARLKSDIKAEGILDRSYGFYAALTVLVFAGYALATGIIVMSDSYLVLLLACLAFSFFTVQLAGIMHDCGHRAVFASTRNNDLLGFFAAAAIGMMLGSWRLHHNQHHAFPNQLERDPDFDIPMVSLNLAQLARKGRFGRTMARYQAFYFYVIVATASLSNRLGGITFFLKRHGDLINLIAYLPVAFALFAGPFLLFPIDKALFVFVTVHLTSGLYLANCFAPNHKGMTTLPVESNISFLEQQVVTARNVRGGVICDVLMVGLNHQIEHHLFPNTPRNKLARLQPHVQSLCEREGIPYLESSFIQGGRSILSSLHGVTRDDSQIRAGAAVETA